MSFFSGRLPNDTDNIIPDNRFLNNGPSVISSCMIPIKQFAFVVPEIIKAGIGEWTRRFKIAHPGYF